MEGYKNAVMAIDLDDDAKRIYSRALRVLTDEAELKLIHVMSLSDVTYFGAPPYAPVLINPGELEEEIISLKTKHLNDISKKLGIKSENAKLLKGKPANEIKNYALDNNCDLIVVGTHGKHGLGLMLGSVANGVLHGAPCDVLAVRVKE